MKNYKLTISYDGSRYSGWQRQATTDNTIQYIIERSLGRLVGWPGTGDEGSGRTDSGVHARGQVASVKLGKLYGPAGTKECFEPVSSGRYSDSEGRACGE